MDRLLHTSGAAEVEMGFALRRRRFNSWFFILTGVWLLVLVGAATRGAAIATAQSGTFIRKVLAPALLNRRSN